MHPCTNVRLMVAASVLAAISATLDDILNGYGLQHTFEIYDHVNRIAERLEHNVLPFFAASLAFNR